MLLSRTLYYGCVCVQVCVWGGTWVQNLLVCLSLHLQILLLWTDATGMQYESPPPSLFLSPSLPLALSPTYALPAPPLQRFFHAPWTRCFSLYPSNSLLKKKKKSPHSRSPRYKNHCLWAASNVCFSSSSSLLPIAKCRSALKLSFMSLSKE